MLIVFVSGNFNFNDSEKNQHLADFFYSIFRGLVIFFQYIKPKFNAWVNKISLPCKVLNLQKKPTHTKHVPVYVLTMKSNLIFEKDYYDSFTIQPITTLYK